MYDNHRNTKMSKDTRKLEQACNYLIMLIKSGIDFPDAAFKASQKFKVNQSMLEREYDRY